MAKGDVTQTSKTELSPEQKQLLGLGMPYAERFASKPLAWPTERAGPALGAPQMNRLQHLRALQRSGADLNPTQTAAVQRLGAANRAAHTMRPMDTVANFTPQQREGQQMALSAAGTQNQIAGGAKNAFDFLTSGDLMNVEKNPYFAPAASAAARPLTQSLTETELPALRNAAAMSGNFGSSRQGIAEGLATGRTNQAIGDLTSKMALDTYGQGLQAYQNGLNMAPTVQGMQTAGALTTSGVGDVRQAQQQREIDQRVARANFAQMAPFMQASDILSLIQGTPGATNVTTGPGPTTNPISGALGGLTLGSALTPFLGPAAPIAGAGLGGLMSFL